jgi:hypothetical protein
MAFQIPISLGGSIEEMLVARQLAALRLVRVDLNEDQVQHAPLLIESGYRAIPSAIDFLVSLPVAAQSHDWRWQRNLARSQNHWQDHALELVPISLASTSIAEVVETLYYPIFVREFYTRGISPYGAHTLKAFERILQADPHVLYVVKQGVVVGGCILKTQAAARRVPLFGERARGGTAEGLIYVLQSDLHECKRALLAKIAQWAYAHGFTNLSLGREPAIVDPEYLPVLREKLRWATAVEAVFGPSAHYLSPCSPTDSGSRLVFQYENGNVSIVCDGPLTASGRIVIGCIAKKRSF